MAKILFMYPNKIFLEFIVTFLGRHGYEVATAATGHSIYTIAAKNYPDLIIVGNTLPGLELRSFLFKKRVSSSIKYAPVYLIGNFSSKELLDLKEFDIAAYFSSPLNPFALLEKINQRFRVSLADNSHKTPMLTDMHVKGKIFVIQIEANLEPNKLDLINFKIRSYCTAHKIEDPRLLFIIPSMYPETLTPENLDILFYAPHYPELKIFQRQIKILTKCEHFIKAVQQHPVYMQYELVPDYIYGIEHLNIDFDNMKKIPTGYLSAGSQYILDLYDENGEIRIPARTYITPEIAEYFKKSDLKHLIYYSAKDISELMSTAAEEKTFTSDIATAENILNQHDEFEESTVVNENMEEKMSLFFNKIRDQRVLVISDKTEESQFIKESLSEILHVEIAKNGTDAKSAITANDYILVIIDINYSAPPAHELLAFIRNKAGKSNTTVIIQTHKINAETLQKFRKIGTDYVLVYPYTKQRLLQKVFTYVTQDQGAK